MNRLGSITGTVLLAAQVAACDSGFGDGYTESGLDAAKEDPLCVVPAPAADNTAKREDAPGVGS